jgi:hypothetical protein
MRFRHSSVAILVSSHTALLHRVFIRRLTKDILKFSLEIGLRNRKKDTSRKDAKHAKFGEIFFSLRSWRLGAINFLEVVLFNILKVRIRETRNSKPEAQFLPRRPA